jgi:hypothetical protein
MKAGQRFQSFSTDPGSLQSRQRSLSLGGWQSSLNHQNSERGIETFSAFWCCLY